MKNLSAMKLQNRLCGNTGSALFAMLLGVLSMIPVSVSAGDDEAEFKRYAISQLDKPFELDCATKHAKYLPPATKKDTEEMALASISGDTGTVTGGKPVQRLSYNRKMAGYDAPDVVLLAADGSEVNFAELLHSDRPVMLNFIFTTCTTICPVLSASFEQVQSLLGAEAERVRMISVSIDPEFDTPRKLAEYAERFSAGSQWTFLTGKINDVVAVEKAFDIYRGSKTNHEPLTLLRSGHSDEWLRIEGFANASEIVAEYQNLIASDDG